MDTKNTFFHWVVLGGFFLAALVGFVLFSGYEGTSEDADVQIGEVVIWGTLDQSIFDATLKRLRSETANLYSGVTYIEKDKETYDIDILEALASGQSPDLILLSNDNIVRNFNKIHTIPYSSYPQRDFMDTYTDAFQTFLTPDGALAIPFLIDPIVMYYNKDIFKNNGRSLPPKTWQEFFELSEIMTQQNDKEAITQSAVALGEFSNLDNAKAIVATFIMQSGNSIVEISNNGIYQTVNWGREFKNPVSNLLFFSEFSNPTNSMYSWNRSLPRSRDYFLSGRLAVYFGFSSEAKKIRLKNANLNFDIAEMPYMEEDKNKAVFAKIWGLAIPKAAPNKVGAFRAAVALSSESAQSVLVERLYLPPVRKDILSRRHPEPFMDIFYREAIYAQSFVDPDAVETGQIFNFMTDSIKTGRRGPTQSVETAFREIDILLRGVR